MDRRTVMAVCCSGVITPIVGCLDRDNSTTDTDPQGSDTETVDALEVEQMSAVHAALVSEAPSESYVTKSTHEVIATDPVIEEILLRSTKSDTDFSTGKRASGEYEIIAIDTEEMDREELYDAAVSLENLPMYDKDSAEHPLGRYIEHEDQLLVFGYAIDD